MTDHHSNQQRPVSKLYKPLILWLLASTLFIVIVSPFESKSGWDLIKKRGTLLYGTRTSLLSYFKTNETIIGYEYQLLKRFTDEHGLELVAEVYNNNGDLFRDLKAGKIDVAGGHLTVTKERLSRYQFSEPFSQTAIDLITHFEHKNKTSIKQFESTKGLLIEDSSYEELLNDLPNFEPENLDTTANHSLFELIRKINSKEIDYTFGDSEIINIYQHFIPGIYQVIQLSPATDTAFMLRAERTENLKAKLNQFILKAKESDLLNILKQEIVLHLPEIDPANTVTFFDKLQTSWPKVKDLIFKVANEKDFDPALLAAISYQESHWEADAISISGVKGLMMLTASTAEEMDVKDRTDPQQSLEGGIKYLRYMQRKMPNRITKANRILFALAAYNIGYGHLEDARILTQKAGGNPDEWLDVEPYLAQLNNPNIEHQLKYGNADGTTAVIYVNNIMTYKQLMNWKINKEQNSNNLKQPIL